MDVVFLIDATGSMASTLRAAHDKAAELAINLRVKNPAVKFQFGSVCYRDPVDSPSDTHQVHQLSEDIDSLVAFLATVRAAGGGDGPEDWVGAYDLALAQVAWRDGAKTIIHIADAPAHGERYCGYANHEAESGKLAPLIEKVASRGILVTGLDLNSGATLSFNECKAIYEAAHGRKYTVQSFTVQGQWGEGAGPAPMMARDLPLSRACMAARPSSCAMRARRSTGGKAAPRADMAAAPRLRCCAFAPPPDAAAPPSAGIALKLAEATESACDDALRMEYE